MNTVVRLRTHQLKSRQFAVVGPKIQSTGSAST